MLAAAAAVRNAELALHRTELASPVSGIIAKRSVEVGQRVAAGTPLMAVVPLEDVSGRCELQGSAVAAHESRASP